MSETLKIDGKLGQAIQLVGRPNPRYGQWCWACGTDALGEDGRWRPGKYDDDEVAWRASRAAALAHARRFADPPPAPPAGEEGECELAFPGPKVIDRYTVANAEAVAALQAENAKLKAERDRLLGDRDTQNALYASAHESLVAVQAERDKAVAERDAAVSEARFLRAMKEEEFERAALAEGCLDRIGEMLRDNMQLLIPDWDFHNPDIVAGVQAELSHMQSEMIQAQMAQESAESSLAAERAIRERLVGALERIRDWPENSSAGCVAIAAAALAEAKGEA